MIFSQKLKRFTMSGVYALSMVCTPVMAATVPDPSALHSQSLERTRRKSFIPQVTVLGSSPKPPSFTADATSAEPSPPTEGLLGSVGRAFSWFFSPSNPEVAPGSTDAELGAKQASSHVSLSDHTSSVSPVNQDPILVSSSDSDSDSDSKSAASSSSGSAPESSSSSGSASGKIYKTCSSAAGSAALETPVASKSTKPESYSSSDSASSDSASAGSSVHETPADSRSTKRQPPMTQSGRVVGISNTPAGVASILATLGVKGFPALVTPAAFTSEDSSSAGPASRSSASSGFQGSGFSSSGSDSSGSTSAGSSVDETPAASKSTKPESSASSGSQGSDSKSEGSASGSFLASNPTSPDSRIDSSAQASGTQTSLDYTPVDEVGSTVQSSVSTSRLLASAILATPIDSDLGLEEGGPTSHTVTDSSTFSTFQTPARQGAIVVVSSLTPLTPLPPITRGYATPVSAGSRGFSALETPTRTAQTGSPVVFQTSPIRELSPQQITSSAIVPHTQSRAIQLMPVQSSDQTMTAPNETLSFAVILGGRRFALTVPQALLRGVFPRQAYMAQMLQSRQYVEPQPEDRASSLVPFVSQAAATLPQDKPVIASTENNPAPIVQEVAADDAQVVAPEAQGAAQHLPADVAPDVVQEVPAVVPVEVPNVPDDRPVAVVYEMPIVVEQKDEIIQRQNQNITELPVETKNDAPKTGFITKLVVAVGLGAISGLIGFFTLGPLGALFGLLGILGGLVMGNGDYNLAKLYKNGKNASEISKSAEDLLAMLSDE